MENAETILEAIDKFESGDDSGSNSSILEDYLKCVAKSGDPVVPWNRIRSFIRHKLSMAMTEFFDFYGGDDEAETANLPSFSYTPTKERILCHFDTYVGAPFTIQRLCEILVDPMRQYKRTDKFLRALEKNIFVVSHIEPGRSKRKLESPHPFLVNGQIPPLEPSSPFGNSHSPTGQSGRCSISITVIPDNSDSPEAGVNGLNPHSPEDSSIESPRSAKRRRLEDVGESSTSNQDEDAKCSKLLKRCSIKKADGEVGVPLKKDEEKKEVNGEHVVMKKGKIGGKKEKRISKGENEVTSNKVDENASVGSSDDNGIHCERMEDSCNDVEVGTEVDETNKLSNECNEADIKEDKEDLSEKNEKMDIEDSKNDVKEESAKVLKKSETPKEENVTTKFIGPILEKKLETKIEEPQPPQESCNSKPSVVSSEMTESSETLKETRPIKELKKSPEKACLQTQTTSSNDTIHLKIKESVNPKKEKKEASTLTVETSELNGDTEVVSENPSDQQEVLSPISEVDSSDTCSETSSRLEPSEEDGQADSAENSTPAKEVAAISSKDTNSEAAAIPDDFDNCDETALTEESKEPSTPPEISGSTACTLQEPDDVVKDSSEADSTSTAVTVTESQVDLTENGVKTSETSSSNDVTSPEKSIECASSLVPEEDITESTESIGQSAKVDAVDAEPNENVDADASPISTSESSKEELIDSDNSCSSSNS